MRFLANRAPYSPAELDRLLEHDEVSAHPFVYNGELLIGDKGGRREIGDSISLTTWPSSCRMLRSSRSRANAACTAEGSDGSDVHLLASALVARLKLWTTDSALDSRRPRTGCGLRLTTDEDWRGCGGSTFATLQWTTFAWLDNPPSRCALYSGTKPVGLPTEARSTSGPASQGWSGKWVSNRRLSDLGKVALYH